MRRISVFTVALTVVLVLMSGPELYAAPSSPQEIEGFVEVNGVRLQYLDWGGVGPALILVHGLADTPHVFDDLVPAFEHDFHVIAYALRGSGNSDVTGPYDVSTNTEDLRALMDALGILRADLVGYSAGGNEVTEMAARHPERVRRVIYLDGGYDWSDQDFKAFIKSLPARSFDPPESAMTSLASFRSYLKSSTYAELDDMRRIEANFRDKIVVQSDGSVKFRTPADTLDALYAALWGNPPRDYADVQCPVLAIYASYLYDLHVPDTARRRELETYERTFWLPFQTKSIERLQREIRHANIVHVSGAHSSFFMTDRAHVVKAMKRFLGESSDSLQNGARPGDRTEGADVSRQ